MALPVKTIDYAPRWFAVDSSWIARIGWLENIRAGGTVFVEVRDQKTGRLRQYAHYDVSRFVWQAFREASSKGEYWNAVLRGRYQEQRIR